jgi:protocatechuate 3,4-dioxygenase beta subunit
MRGEQISDSVGNVKFQTVIPGWYAGRLVHLHVRVFLPSGEQFCTQLYFSDTILSIVAELPVYKRRGLPAGPPCQADIELTEDCATLAKLTLDVYADETVGSFKASYALYLNTTAAKEASAACFPVS